MSFKVLASDFVGCGLQTDSHLTAAAALVLPKTLCRVLPHRFVSSPLFSARQAGLGLVWPLPPRQQQQQLIKNSIFISPIIHSDFIVEWMAALCSWSAGRDWIGLYGQAGRADGPRQVFTFLHIDFDGAFAGTFTLAFAPVHFNSANLKYFI